MYLIVSETIHFYFVSLLFKEWRKESKAAGKNFALFKIRSFDVFSPVTLGYPVIPNLRATPAPYLGCKLGCNYIPRTGPFQVAQGRGRGTMNLPGVAVF